MSDIHTIDSFNQLDLDSQGREVFGRDNYVDTINGVVLYQYGDFIVECYYNQETNEIERMEGISIVDAADKYVKIEELMP